MHAIIQYHTKLLHCHCTLEQMLLWMRIIRPLMRHLIGSCKSDLVHPVNGPPPSFVCVTLPLSLHWTLSSWSDFVSLFPFFRPCLHNNLWGENGEFLPYFCLCTWKCHKFIMTPSPTGCFWVNRVLFSPSLPPPLSPTHTHTQTQFSAIWSFCCSRK